jgi:two-component system response regulator NreC
MTEVRCVLLADAHLGLSDGVRGLLATTFDAVIMVGDEVSLFESAARLQTDLAVVDLGLSRGNAMGLVRRFRSTFPNTKIIVISVHPEASISRAVMEAGADGFIVKKAIATELLAATAAVLMGNRYVSPVVQPN